MSPAFDSHKQAVAFALLLFFVLAAPWLGGKSLLPGREQAYAREGAGKWGPYPWIRTQIFEETNDLDIAFIGSSHIDFDIDTPYVQAKLDEQAGHKTVVRSISWFGAGFDSLYIVTRDLLAHRHVKTLVFYDEISPQPVHPNANAPHWFRFGEDGGELSGVTLRDKSVFYFASVVGMPKNLLELANPILPLAPNGTTPSYYDFHYHADDPATRLGSTSARITFSEEMNAYGRFTSFAPCVPQTGATSADVYVYSAASATHFTFTNPRVPDWQTHFARRFGLLAKNHHCKLVLLHLPTWAEKTSSVITEPRYWPDLLQTEVAMVGIPTGQLFAGLSDQQLKQLFCDPWHMNQNGQQYFTALITPALLQLHENQPAR